LSGELQPKMSLEAKIVVHTNIQGLKTCNISNAWTKIVVGLHQGSEQDSAVFTVVFLQKQCSKTISAMQSKHTQSTL